MPLTEKGKKIMKSMQKQYEKKKAEEVFYASKNAGKITGVDKNMKTKKAKTGKLLEKEADKYLEERSPGARHSDKDRERILDMLRDRSIKDPEPPKQKIEFDEAKKGKMMSRKSGSPKKGENVMMKEKQKLFKEIDQAQKSLKPKKLKGGGAAIRGMNFKGVF